MAGLTRLDLTLRGSVTDVSYCPSAGFSRGTASPGASLGTLMQHQVASGRLQVGCRFGTVGSNLGLLRFPLHPTMWCQIYVAAGSVGLARSDL